MKIVVDTNIIFSTLLNPNSTIDELVMNAQDVCTFYAPYLIIEELQKYRAKIASYSKLSPKKIRELKKLILQDIEIVEHQKISIQNWRKAYNLTKEVDENDTPFVALALQLKAQLWTGDKKLKKGVDSKYENLVLNTDDIKKILE